MRRFLKKLSVVLAGILLTAVFLNLVSADGQNVVCAEGSSTELNLVFTHDLHSHLESFYAELDGREQLVGGFARIKTFINEAKTEDPQTLVIDGGDFSMGTLYQTVFETEAAELRMLGELGMDVTTMGNHEFDYRTVGLNNMLRSAKNSGDPLPDFVLCNVDWEATLAADGSGESLAARAELKDTFDAYGIKDYVMLERNGIRIAVIGVFGKDALSCAPTCELVFRDPIEAVKDTVARIEAEEDADMIICLSHGGTWEDEKKSEDELLAKAVPQLDLILSGHTHSTLVQPIVHGNTSIVSCGEYGMRAGKLTLKRKEDGRWSVSDYDVCAMTADVAEDPDTLEKIQSFNKAIDTDYLSRFGYTQDQVLIRNPYKIPNLREIYDQHQEQPYCNLLSDSYLYVVNHLESHADDPAQIAVVPTGVIRDVFAEDSDITVGNVYNVFSLGIGRDGVPGYPLVSIYLTGKELKTMAEIDASITGLMSTAQLFASGLSYHFNPNRLILNRVTDVLLMEQNGQVEELQEDQLYHVVADLYSGQMLGAVTDMSFGILSLVPKDAQGNPVEDLEEFIVYDEQGKEVKAWEAVANYLEYLSAEHDGLIPEYYNETQGRKIVDDQTNIGAILRHPNKIAIALVLIVAVVLIILVGIVVLVVKLIRRISGKRKKKQEIDKHELAG